MEVLNVQNRVVLDNSIIEKEYHNHIPFGSPKYANNDEIRILIPEIDRFTLPCESDLLIEGSLRLASDPTKPSQTASLIHNAGAYMFSSIVYIINGTLVDEIRNAGITSTMKGYFSFTAGDVPKVENYGWDFPTGKANVLDKNGNFGFCLPLKMLLGFAEDYKQILMNVPQELVLKRASDDSDAILNTNTTEELKLTIHNVVWRVPHISVGMKQDYRLTQLSNKNTLMEMFFRGWEFYENPNIPESTKYSWSIKTAPHLETPRYIILGFQTGRKGKVDKNMSKFDPISLTDVTAYLNGKRYPYENITADFEENRVAVLYDMYSKFQKVYHQYPENEPFLKFSQFKMSPLVGIDCSHQDDRIHKSGVEVRIDIATKNNIPKDTILYCVILHNKRYEYSPFNKMVQRKY